MYARSHWELQKSWWGPKLAKAIWRKNKAGRITLSDIKPKAIIVYKCATEHRQETNICLILNKGNTSEQ